MLPVVQKSLNFPVRWKQEIIVSVKCYSGLYSLWFSMLIQGWLTCGTSGTVVLCMVHDILGKGQAAQQQQRQKTEGRTGDCEQGVQSKKQSK